MSNPLPPGRGRLNPIRLLAAQKAFTACLLTGLVAIPAFHGFDLVSIETVNMLGRYMTFAIVAIGLDLVWGYTGILSLCQALFFSLGGYAMGMYLAHHGGPEGITDRLGWKLPACLYVVYPYDIGEVPEDAMLPWFWKPFWNLPLTVLLGLLVPGLAALVIGYFGFRSRVRGVYFAILTQAIAVAAFLFFQRNEVKFCGTNGLTRFVQLASPQSITTLKPDNQFPSHHFRGEDGWSFTGQNHIIRHTGVEFAAVGLHLLSNNTKNPLTEGVEHTTLLTLAGTGSTNVNVTLTLLDKNGQPASSTPLRPIRLRGTSWTEFRADFIPGPSLQQVQFTVDAKSPDPITLYNPRLFKRYNSATGGFTLSSHRVQLVLYLLTVLALAGVFLTCKYIVGSRFGRVLVAVRDDETTLRFLGYRPWVYKLAAFVGAAFFAGLAGMLYTPQMKIITPYDMEAGRSILVVIWVAVGGRGSLTGAIAGALSVNLLYDYFTSEHDYGIVTWKAEYWQFILGALFIGVVLVFPNGLIKVWQRTPKK